MTETTLNYTTESPYSSTRRRH